MFAYCNKFVLFLCFFSFWGLSNALSQPTIILDANKKSSIDVSQNSIYLEDATHQISIQELMAGKHDKKFKPVPAKGFGFGFNSSNFWLKIKVKNTNYATSQLLVTNQAQWYLEINNPTLDSLEFYYLDTSKNKLEVLRAGDRIPIQNQAYFYNNYVFPLFFQDNEEKTFYLKIQTQGSAQTEITLRSANNFEYTAFNMRLLYGILFGILSGMLIYNLFLLTAIRQTTYVYYCSYVFFYINSQLSYSGIGYQYFWGSYSYLSNLLTTFWILMTAIFTLLFALNFLGVRALLPKFYPVLKGYVGLLTLAAISCFFLPYRIHAIMTSILAFISSILAFSLGLIAWLKGKDYAKYYLIAWSFFLVSIIVFTLKGWGFLPQHFLLHHAHQIGAVIEILLLSIALADQINVYRKEKEKALQENEQLLANQNKILEEKVLERTYELQEKQDEIMVQNEELIQQREEILTQRDFIEQQHEELIQKDKRLESSIKAAKTIQVAILPYKNKLDTLLKHYFVLNMPKDIVSGDFYWLNRIENLTILAVADCTGHGVQGAFMTLIGNTLLDKIIRVWNITEPAQILNRLHDEVNIVLHQNDGENNTNGMDIAILTWETQQDQTFAVKFASAKRPLYFIKPNSNALEELKGSRKGIGGVQNPHKKFEIHNLSLPAYTKIYLCSDGYTDQNNLDRKKLSENTLKQLLSQNHHLPMSEQQNILQGTIIKHMKGTNQRDDILVVGVELLP